MRVHFCKILESVQDIVDSKYFRYKEAECKIYLSMVSEDDDVADLYGFDYNLDTRKVSESTTPSRLSEPDTVSDLYGIDYTESLTNLLSYWHLELQRKDADYD